MLAIFLSNLFLAEGEPFPYQMLVLFAGIGLVMYFFMIRPAKKKEDVRRKMLSDLTKKDKIMTAGGIYGTVKTLADKKVTIVVDESNGTTLTLSRGAISRNLTAEEKLQKESGAAPEEKPDDKPDLQT